MDLKNYARDDWVEKTDSGAVNVAVRMLLVDRRSSLAEVRLQTQAQFLNNEGVWDCHMMCTEGSGYIEIDGVESRIRSGDAVLWPKGINTRLWTENDGLTVLLLEHLHQVAHIHHD